MEVDISEWMQVVSESISVTIMTNISSTKVDSTDRMNERASRAGSSIDVVIDEVDVQCVHEDGWSK